MPDPRRSSLHFAIGPVLNCGRHTGMMELISSAPNEVIFTSGIEKGRAVILHDKNKIIDLWQFILKNWFLEGAYDPRITLIKVTPGEGYYWGTKHGAALAGVKMLLGSVLGTTMDDSIEGKVLPHG